jgi:predicted methyltransferase
MDYANDVAYQAEPSHMQSSELKPFDDLLQYLREYARERPEVMALTCFGIGFILGWKLKPW